MSMPCGTNVNKQRVRTMEIEPVAVSQKEVPKKGISFIRRKELLRKIGISNSTLYDWLNPTSPRHKPDFPHRKKIGANIVVWIQSEVDDWILRQL